MSFSAGVVMGASLLAAPSWIETPFISYRDYPDMAVRNEWSAGVLMDLLIAPDGKVAKCTPLAGFGNADFASMFCAIASKKKASPPKDQNGLPAYGVVRELVTFYLKGTEEGRLIEGLAPLKPDFQFEVERLPAAVGPTVDTAVAVSVEESGRINGCEPTAAADKRYGRAACDQLLGTVLAVASNASDQPVRYVQLLRVRFAAPDGG